MTQNGFKSDDFMLCSSLQNLTKLEMNDGSLNRLIRREWSGRPLFPALQELKLAGMELHSAWLETAFIPLHQLQRLDLVRCSIGKKMLQLSPANTLR